ncbi:MAG TPA: hypothetical protein VMV79_02080, partial [Alphaproteobacteria bacterium]|nr:hypothetical protein [Alphaproteobacteria bacterium]
MSNTMISLEDVFLPSVLRIMEKWREVAIITGQNAFQFVPQKENPTYRPGEKYPLLRGRSAPNWVLDDVGNDFVAKDGITRRLSSAAGKSAIKMEIKLAHERIYGHFAWKLGLPFPPTCIWETCKDGKPKYYSISMRAFPDSECDPPKRFLRRTPFLPSIAIQDLWMDHIDGHGANIVY